MSRLISIAILATQILIVGSGLTWAAGKIGFIPAKPYAEKIEEAVKPIVDKVSVGS